MSRVARVAPKGYIFHILARGNNRKNVFKEEADYRKYIDIILRYKEKFLFKLYHYVLMTNHVHLVVETTAHGGELAQIMKCINLSYAQHYKNKYRHYGHFWQDRYKSIIISKDTYLLACGSYVELNPVRAKIVEDPKDYQWSSYTIYAYGKKKALVDEHPIYEGLGKSEQERRRTYREFVKGMLKEKKAQKGEMDRRLIYGGEDFKEEIGKRFQMEAMIKHRGRPKKDKEDKNDVNKKNRPL